MGRAAMLGGTVGLALILAGAPVVAEQSQVGLKWRSDTHVAHQEALARNLPLIIYFTGDWCNWCSKIDQEVFNTPVFWSYWPRAVFVRGDPDRDDSRGNVARLAEELHIERYPALVVLQAWKNTLGEVGRIVGYHPAAKFTAQLDILLARWETRIALEPKPLMPGSLDHAGLREMLRALELHPSPAQAEGQYHRLTVKQDTWTYDIRLSIDADRHQILLMSPLAVVPPTQQGHGEHVLRLLAQNEAMGATHFAFNPSTRMISIHRPVPNVGLIPALLRNELDEFMSIIRRTHHLWDPVQWKAPQVR